MKIIKLLTIVSAIFLSTVKIFGQEIHESDISVAFNKTSTLVFPFAVESVDRGSQDILAQKVKGVENVLQVKAGSKEFSETNLTVITADGNVHLFAVHYCEDPEVQARIISSSTKREDANWVYFSDNLNEQFLSKISKRVLSTTSRTEKANMKYKIKLSLKGIFVHNDFIFYKIQIKNSSNINYDIQSVRFYIKDRQKVKRTAIQEIGVDPVHIQSQSFQVKGNAKIEMVYVLPKLTIPDAKRLSIELYETNGGRHLKLDVGNNTIVKARAVRN